MDPGSKSGSQHKIRSSSEFRQNLLCIHKRFSCVYTRDYLVHVQEILLCIHKRFSCACAREYTRESLVYTQENGWVHVCGCWAYVYETVGCMYADVGRMSMERLGACMRMLGAYLGAGSFPKLPSGPRPRPPRSQSTHSQ